jgi:hypothetical protein
MRTTAPCHSLFSVETIIATSNWTMVEAVAAAVSAGVLLIGGYLAQRYGQGADASLRARTFPRTNGDFGLEVQIDVRCVGLRAVRIACHRDHLPRVTVSAVADNDGRLIETVEHEITTDELVGQQAGPGESINWTQRIPLRAVAPGLAGWSVVFRFSTRHQFARWRYWTWNETAFVPVREGGQSSLHPGDP